MKKAILAAAIASLSFATTAFAAVPGTDLAAGQIKIGYSYSNQKNDIGGVDFGDFHTNDFQAAYGLTDKLALTGDFLKSESKDFYYTGTLNDVNFKTTELGLQYKLSDSFALAAGNVKSEVSANDIGTSTSEVYAGVNYKAAISSNMDGYASYLRSSNIEDWKTGVTYGIGDNTSLDLGYRHLKNDDLGTKADGMSFGVNHKF